MRYHGLYLGVQLRFVTIANQKNTSWDVTVETMVVYPHR